MINVVFMVNIVWRNLNQAYLGIQLNIILNFSNANAITEDILRSKYVILYRHHISNKYMIFRVFGNELRTEYLNINYGNN